MLGLAVVLSIAFFSAVSISDNATEEQEKAFCDCVIYCNGVSDLGISVKALKTPIIDIPVDITIIR